MRQHPGAWRHGRLSAASGGTAFGALFPSHLLCHPLPEYAAWHPAVRRSGASAGSPRPSGTGKGFGKRLLHVSFCGQQLPVCGLPVQLAALTGRRSVSDVWTAALASLQSAVCSVVLEWKWPIQGWRTESELWRHPRKYLVPALLLLLTAAAGAWPGFLWLWSGALAAECGALVFSFRPLDK